MTRRPPATMMPCRDCRAMSAANIFASLSLPCLANLPLWELSAEPTTMVFKYTELHKFGVYFAAVMEAGTIHAFTLLGTTSCLCLHD